MWISHDPHSPSFLTLLMGWVSVFNVSKTSAPNISDWIHNNSHPEPLIRAVCNPGASHLGFLAEALKGYGRGDVWRMKAPTNDCFFSRPKPPPRPPNSACVVLISEVMNPSGPPDLKISELFRWSSNTGDVEGMGCDAKIMAAATLTNIKEPGTLSSCIRLTFALLKVTLCHSFLHWQTTALIRDCPPHERIHF